MLKWHLSSCPGTSPRDYGYPVLHTLPSDQLRPRFEQQLVVYPPVRTSCRPRMPVASRPHGRPPWKSRVLHDPARHEDRADRVARPPGPVVPREARRRRPHAALIRSSDIAPRGLVDAFDGGQRVRAFPPPPPSSATALPDHAPTGNWPVNLPRAAATRPLHRRRDAAPPRATSTTSFGMCQTAMGMMIKCTRTHVKTDPATLRRAARA